MEKFEQIYKKLKSHLVQENKSSEDHDIQLNFTKLNGLSNDIYKVDVYNKTTSTDLGSLVYKQFGQSSEFVSRETESAVINSLSAQGVTPKILCSDGETYRIEEYVVNSDVLPRSEINEDDVINKIINILVSYTMISGIYQYQIRSENLQQDYKIDIDSSLRTGILGSNPVTVFGRCLKDMLYKARQNFEIFTSKFEVKYKKITDEKITDINNLISKYKDVKKVTEILKSYEKLFLEVFPKDGIFVVNHNDVHRLNILYDENKQMILLDHEYASLNLVGIDIVNYLIETNFDYTKKSYPFCEFTKEEVNLEGYFEIFLKFIEKFESVNVEFFKDKRNQSKINKMKKFKYFLKLVCIISLFWLLYSLIYLDHDSWEKKEAFDCFIHAQDRIHLYEEAFKKLGIMKMEKMEKMGSGSKDLTNLSNLSKNSNSLNSLASMSTIGSDLTGVIVSDLASVNDDLNQNIMLI